MPKSWKVEVIADRSGEWCSNALRFERYDDAAVYAVDLASRWVLVERFRVVESDDPVTEPAKELEAQSPIYDYLEALEKAGVRP